MESENNQDWANLKRYEDENLSLGHPQENEKRVVFMGDSITEEWSRLYPNYFDMLPGEVQMIDFEPSENKELKKSEIIAVTLHEMMN